MPAPTDSTEPDQTGEPDVEIEDLTYVTERSGDPDLTKIVEAPVVQGIETRSKS